MQEDEKINVKALCCRYRTNVRKIISAWKKGLSDEEISRVTGLNALTLQQIRADIEMAHRRNRLMQNKSRS